MQAIIDFFRTQHYLIEAAAVVLLIIITMVLRRVIPVLEKKFLRALTASCSAHPDVLDDPPPAAFFVNFADSSLDFKVTCRVPEWGMQWQTAEDIRSEIYNTFEREGIEIPFPQRVVTRRDEQPHVS
ncbi:mechanosensitive ion channel [bacterium]|nr:mechanosensitive ion channel [bacterium]